MSEARPEEAKNFRLLGHDPSAAWGGGSLCEIKDGYAYVGAVGGSSYGGLEGFTVHDVSDPTKPPRPFSLLQLGREWPLTARTIAIRCSKSTMIRTID